MDIFDHALYNRMRPRNLGEAAGDRLGKDKPPGSLPGGLSWLVDFSKSGGVYDTVTSQPF